MEVSKELRDRVLRMKANGWQPQNRKPPVARTLRPVTADGATGVSYAAGKYRATIIENGKHRTIGRFNTKEEAAAARREAERQRKRRLQVRLAREKVTRRV